MSGMPPNTVSAALANFQDAQKPVKIAAQATGNHHAPRTAGLMWLNSNRQSVEQWEAQQGDSRCPLCNRMLTPRRGDWVSWHWAHQPERGNHAKCPWEETPWHLNWKATYRDVPEWEIEYAWSSSTGQRFVLDACNPSQGRAIEFVHSISEYYVAKHQVLKAAGLRVQWIWDGALWVSARSPSARDGGQKRFLKARAFDIFQQLEGLVHWREGFWRHWKANVWYRLDTANTRKALASYTQKGALQEHAVADDSDIPF